MQLLDGRVAREHYFSILKERVSKLSFSPCLAIVQVGNREDSSIYIRSKKAFAEKIGVKVFHDKLDEKISEGDLLKIIEKHNLDKEIQGIILQLPLPVHLNPEVILNAIDSKKDSDGLTPNTIFTPATPRGIKELLDFYQIDLKNKKVTIIGRSKIVGKPMAILAEKSGAIVTVCHRETVDIPSKTKSADILIVAIGQPNFIDEKYVSKDQIVIDVGITRYLEEGLVGDVDFKKVKDIVAMITPVPGGVGQMTVLALFENLVDACYNTNI